MSQQEQDTGGSATGDTMVAALLRERQGLALRGKDDRVEQVDEQLRLRGYGPDGKQLPVDDQAVDDGGDQVPERTTPPKDPKTPQTRKQTTRASG